ncbi:GNAT family N-acetyltransferase [Neptunicella marina]|uniref:GNAT family N-acetyltransferase n=1 Tax=Neptunicella marina TaxID=2125989 RepID=A0A8J6M6R5_9ALTE|nr:GNAT family N-acetyltransferase [Neptunicella marina]
MFIAYQNKKAVASVLLFRTANTLGVHQMGVIPECRGQGIAQQLMGFVIDFARLQGLKYIDLQASSMGRSLYQKLGFKQYYSIYFL